MSLVINRVLDDVEIAEISRISDCLVYLIILKCHNITIFDRKGALSKHAELIQAMLRIRLITLRIESRDKLESSCLAFDVRGERHSINFEKEEIVPTLRAKQPQLALVFNSIRRVLRLDGFPAMLKDRAEFLECGELRTFRVTKFITAIERFGNI